MKLAVIDMMLSGQSLEKKFSHARASGFEGIEVFATQYASLAQLEKQVKRCAGETGLEVLQVVAMQEPWYSPITDRHGLQAKIAAQKDCIRLSAQVGGKLSQVVPEYGPQFVPLGGMQQPSAEEEKYLREFLAETAEFAAQFELLLAVDVINRYETRFFRRLQEAVHICESLGKPNMKAIADFFHLHLEEPDIAAALAAARGFIGHVHLADSNRSLPGDGHIDFQAGFRALKDAGYNDYVSLEVQADFISDPAAQLPAAVKHVRQAWEAS